MLPTGHQRDLQHHKQTEDQEQMLPTDHQRDHHQHHQGERKVATLHLLGRLVVGHHHHSQADRVHQTDRAHQTDHLQPLGLPHRDLPHLRALQAQAVLAVAEEVEDVSFF